MIFPPSGALAGRFLFLFFILLSCYTCPLDASIFSWSSSSNVEEVDASDWVSPIVNREIKVSVKAPWPSSPHNILCEAFLFLKNYGFLDALVKTDALLESYQQATELAIDVAQRSGLGNPLLHFALTMRSQSPTCEMQRGIAETQMRLFGYSPGDIDAFCIINGKTIITDLEDFPEAGISEELEDIQQLLLPQEEPRVSSSKKTGLVILYANLGSPSFATWYEYLVEKNIPLVVRHLGSATNTDETTSSETVLQGFGVRLDIRNVEYKVFDERQTEDEAAALVNVSSFNSSSPTVPHFLAGVNWTALGVDVDVDEQQQLQAKLWKSHDAQRQHAQLIPPTWQRRQLSLQAATAISTSKNNELLTLQDVSQNLPSVASTLVHVQVPEMVSDVAEKMETHLQHLMMTSGGGLWINGKEVAIERPSFNVFELIQTLQLEQEALVGLQNKLEPYLSDKALKEVQLAWSQGKAFFEGGDDDDIDEEYGEMEQNTYIRINTQKGEKGAVIYVNDVEQDPQYQTWPTRLDQMMMAMQYGMPPSVRRNLFTVLSIDDPTTKQINFAKQLSTQLIQNRFPVKVGTLIVDEKDIESCAKWVSQTQSKEGKACPLSKDYWMDKPKHAYSTRDLMQIPLTARDIYRLYSYLAEKYEGRREILQAFDMYLGPSLAQNQPTNGKYLSVFDVIGIQNQILTQLHLLPKAIQPADMVKEILNTEEEDFSYAKAVRFAVDKGLKPGMGFLNGRPLPLSDDKDGGDRTSAIFSEEQNVIFGMVMSQDITESKPKSIYAKLLSSDKSFQPNRKVYPKVHPLLSSSNEGAFLDLNHKFGPHSFLIPETMEGLPSEADAIIGVDAFLDISTRKGLTMAKQFVSVMKNISNKVLDDSVAVAYRIIPSTEAAAKSHLCPLISASAGDVGIKVIEEVLDWKTTKGYELKETTKELLGSSKAIHMAACSETTYLQGDLPSKNFLVANGRVFNLEGVSLDAMDVELLMSVEMDISKSVTTMLRESISGMHKPYDAVSRTAAFLATEKSKASRYNPNENILRLEKSLGVDDNPLRFSWNDEEQSKGLKVSDLELWTKRS